MLSGILKRFHDTINRFENNGNAEKRMKHDSEVSNSEAHKDKGAEEATETKSSTPPVLHGLEPLPQPERVYGDKINTQLDWLTEPITVETDERCSFESLGVSQRLRERLASFGYADAFAVQKAVISHLLKDQTKPGALPLSDILVQSATGSGKTLAYCVPVVEQALKYKVKRVSSLIIVPTRPLLAQVTKVLTDLTKNTQISVASLRQDRSLEQERALLRPASRKNLPSILVATPGRLADHLNEGTLDLRYLDYLVVDEADKLLGQSFSSWTDALARAIPKSEQPCLRRPARRLVFSATLTRDAGKLSQLQIRNSPTPPVVYVIGNQAPASSDGRTREWSVPKGLTESLLRISSNDVKPLILSRELFKTSGKVLVFVSSNETAARLSRLLSLLAEETGVDLSVARCSGEMPAAARKKTLKTFEDNSRAVLVCTDLVARGIDVADISLVVNYDLPSSAQEYVHRVGRTARANTIGNAWTLTSNTFERKSFWIMVSAINRFAKIDIRDVAADAEDETYQKSLARLKDEANAQ